MMFDLIKGNLIHKLAFIDWDYVDIGTGNTIYPFASIGTSAEFPGKDSIGRVVIGNNNTIREHVVINRSVDAITSIGDNNYLMNHSYIAHDVTIEDDCTLACSSMVAGYSYIMNGSFLGMGSAIHQYCIVGSYSLLGLNSVVTKKSSILPGNIYAGIPIKLLKKYIIGLSRKNIDEYTLEIENISYFNLKNEYHIK